MHLPSESLNGAICPVTAVVAAGTIVLAAYILKKNKLKRPTAWQFALTTVAVFALQALNYALPAGFSGHMLGAVFAATILGVPAAILSVALVITVQCLAFNDGGTLQLGANILNMAVVATGIGGLVINRLEYINKTLKRRAVIFIISDFYVPSFSETLARCKRRHDVIALSITEPLENAFPNLGFVTLRNPETGATIELDAGSKRIRQSISEKLKRQREKVEVNLKEACVDLVAIENGGDYVRSLRTFFGNRRRR